MLEFLAGLLPCHSWEQVKVNLVGSHQTEPVLEIEGRREDRGRKLNTDGESFKEGNRHRLIYRVRTEEKKDILRVERDRLTQ